MITSAESFISLFALHFTQYASAILNSFLVNNSLNVRTNEDELQNESNFYLHKLLTVSPERLNLAIFGYLIFGDWLLIIEVFFTKY
ncbi:MAG: hypothetical protein ACI9UR_001963 [Bacteroidia bacterium]|jgi:hypothetical protein